jgi:hypothetical protein
MSSRRVTDAAWGVALALGTWAAWCILVARRPCNIRFEAADTFVSFLPAYSHEAARLREGAFSLWNPHQGMGVPFLTTLQPGALPPARLLFLLTDVPTAMGWSNVGHPVLLVVATWALCRVLGARSAAAVGAAVFVVVSRRLRDYVRVLVGSPPGSAAVIPFTGVVLPGAPLAHPELLDLAAVHHLVLPKDGAVHTPTRPLVHVADFEVYDPFENPRGLPRAYVVDRARVVADAGIATVVVCAATSVRRRRRQRGEA